MAGYTREEALAFVDAIRLTIQGKTGFKWMVEKLTDLSAFIDAEGAENEALNDYVDATGQRAEYESYRAAHADITDRPEEHS